MDRIRLQQLTKEIVAEELRRLGDPCEVAAQVLRKTLSAALSTAEDSQRLIDDAVKGAMTALLLADHSVIRGSVLALQTVLEATEGRVEPTFAARAALKALADLRRFVPPERTEEIRAALEARWPGFGQTFAEFLGEPYPGMPTPSSQPAQRPPSA